MLPVFADPTKTMAYTRATTFAKSISDTYVLSQWSQRMVAKGLALRPDLFALAAAHPLDDRDELNKVCEAAKDAAGAKARASLGTALHAFTEQTDKGLNPNVPAQWSPEVAAYSRLVADTGLTFVPGLIERIVIVPAFGVAGTFDRIGLVTQEIRIDLTPAGAPDGAERIVVLKVGDHVVVDLKTGRDLTYGWAEIAIQLGIYSHGAAMWRKGTKHFDRMPANLRQDVALVIHLPIREDPKQEARAELYGVDIGQGWDAAELCHQVRTWRKTRNLAAPVMVAKVDGAVAGVVAAVEDMAASPNPVVAAIGQAAITAASVPADASAGAVVVAVSEAPAVANLAELPPCGAVSVDGIVSQPCTMVGRHLVHTDGRVRWPVVGLPSGTGCIQCGARSKDGRIAHKRGCSDATRGRQGTPIPEPAPTPAGAIPGVTDEKHCPGCGTTIKAAMARCVSCALVRGAEQVATAMAPLADAAQRVAVAVSPVTTPVKAIPTTTQAPTWADRIDAASAPGELSTIRREALAAGEWTPALQARGLAQLSKIRTL